MAKKKKADKVKEIEARVPSRNKRSAWVIKLFEKDGRYFDAKGVEYTYEAERDMYIPIAGKGVVNATE